jgi:hypothetical protein
MKYTAKIKQAQLVGKIKIEPKGGDLNADQIAEIKKDPWGKELIRKGVLAIEGVKPGDILDEPKKGSPKKEPLKRTDASAAGNPAQTTIEKK